METSFKIKTTSFYSCIDYKHVVVLASCCSVRVAAATVAAAEVSDDDECVTTKVNDFQLYKQQCSWLTADKDALFSSIVSFLLVLLLLIKPPTG